MLLLKTHSHTSDGLATEPAKLAENKLKETQTLQGKPIHQKPVAYRRCGGGGGREEGSTANKPQKRHYENLFRN